MAAPETTFPPFNGGVCPMAGACVKNQIDRIKLICNLNHRAGEQAAFN